MARLSKLFREIRRAELVRQDQQLPAAAGGSSAQQTADLAPQAGQPQFPSESHGALPENPLNSLSGSDAERRALAAARARKAAESATAAQLTARADADRNAARLALQRAEMERQAEMRAQT